MSRLSDQYLAPPTPLLLGSDITVSSWAIDSRPPSFTHYLYIMFLFLYSVALWLYAFYFSWLFHQRHATHHFYKRKTTKTVFGLENNRAYYRYKAKPLWVKKKLFD
jgi:hypothetical protein